jgi:hypothetical protein
MVSVSFPHGAEIFTTITNCYKKMKKFDPLILRAILLRGARMHPTSLHIWEHILILEKKIGNSQQICQLIIEESAKHLSQADHHKLVILNNSK